MQKAGGIVALIAGVLAVLAATYTFILEYNLSSGASNFGYRGVFVSFLIISLSSIAIISKKRNSLIGISIITISFWGSTKTGIVSIFMLLSIIGGILCLLEKKSPEIASSYKDYIVEVIKGIFAALGFFIITGVIFSVLGFSI